MILSSRVLHRLVICWIAWHACGTQFVCAQRMIFAAAHAFNTGVRFDEIVRFSDSGQFLGPLFRLPAGDQALQVVANSEHLYVGVYTLLSDRFRIEKYTLHGELQGVFPVQNGGLFNSFELGSRDSLLLKGEGELRRFNLNGQATLNIPVPLGYGGADEDSAGNIYVASTNHGSDVLGKYASNGAFQYEIPVRRNTSNLVIDEANSRLFLGNGTGGIDIYNIGEELPTIVNSITNIRIFHLHFDPSQASLFAVTTGPSPGIELDSLGSIRQIYALSPNYGTFATINDIVAVYVPEPPTSIPCLLLMGIAWRILGLPKLLAK